MLVLVVAATDADAFEAGLHEPATTSSRSELAVTPARPSSSFGGGRAAARQPAAARATRRSRTGRCCSPRSPTAGARSRTSPTGDDVRATRAALERARRRGRVDGTGTVDRGGAGVDGVARTRGRDRLRQLAARRCGCCAGCSPAGRSSSCSPATRRSRQRPMRRVHRAAARDGRDARRARPAATYAPLVDPRRRAARRCGTSSRWRARR